MRDKATSTMKDKAASTMRNNTLSKLIGRESVRPLTSWETAVDICKDTHIESSKAKNGLSLVSDVRKRTTKPKASRNDHQA